MKTNCPHCQGLIVIPVRCCNGDDAIQGVFTPTQYEKIKMETEKQKTKKKFFEKEFHEKMKQFKVDPKSFFLATFYFFPIAISLSFLIPSIFPGINMGDPRNITELCAVFGLPVILAAGGVYLLAYNQVKKAFFKKHPEYTEFDVS